MGLLWLTVNGYAQFAQVPERVELNWEPKILMTRGPYAYSRHPMYFTELALWLGWAVLYGSIIVLAGFVALCVVMSILAPREERALEAKFGEAYRQYRARVPPWLGVPRGGSGAGRSEVRLALVVLHLEASPFAHQVGGQSADAGADEDDFHREPLSRHCRTLG